MDRDNSRGNPRNFKSRRATGAEFSSAGLELIMGRNCLEEVLRHDPERIKEVFLADSRDGASGGRKGAIREALESSGIPIREKSRAELDQMAQSDSHQGVVARVTPRVYLTLDELISMAGEDRPIKIVAIDGVLDPQNIGAIFRAAECFDIDAVLWSKNRAAPLGPVVAKVSVGASELIPLCPVPNLHRAIESLKEVGVWSVGAVVAPDAISLDTFEPPQKWILVMGSEGEGIQRLIEEKLDFRVYISMLGSISSLNVSQATAVFLHSLSGSRQKPFVKVT
jgi:23S rRNA (guanosine2251-2'-O)-methyltransferase